MDELYEVFRPPTQIEVYRNQDETACLINNDSSSTYSASTVYGATGAFSSTSSLVVLENNKGDQEQQLKRQQVNRMTINHRIRSTSPRHSNFSSTSNHSNRGNISPMYMDEGTQVTAATTGDGSDGYSLSEDAGTNCAAGITGSVRSNITNDSYNNNNGGQNDDNNDASCISAEESVPENPFESHGKLGTLALAVMVFYSVSGGPFGCESSVRAAGHFYTLLGFIIMPFVWSFQEAFMTAELGSAFPEASGGVAWVETAFGQRAGFMSGYLGWLAGATDNAIYPVLFMDYLLQVVKRSDDDSEVDPFLRFFLLSSVSLILSFINWLGLPIVGQMSTSICAVAMSPFFLLVVFGVWHVDPRRWFIMPDTGELQENILESKEGIDDALDIDGGIFSEASWGGILWRPFLNNLFWNLNSFDAAGSFAGDIEGDPGRVFPRAMGLSVLMVTMGYLIPLLVVMGASTAKQSDWVDGYLAKAMSDICGKWLGAFTIFAAGISNIALFQAELSADAFQLMGMADRGYVPKVFAQRSRHGTPTYGIILGTVIIIVMGVSHLDRLIEMLNFNYAIALVMEYCAFIKLRISRPDLHRPYKVPLNTTCCVLVMLPTFLATFMIFALARYFTFIFAIGCNMVGVLIYAASQPGVCGMFTSYFRCPKKYVARYSQVDVNSQQPVEVTVDNRAASPEVDDESYKEDDDAAPPPGVMA